MGRFNIMRKGMSIGTISLLFFLGLVILLLFISLGGDGGIFEYDRLFG
tara:strand:+ start:152 stop:295 length:144 start_codon:yes stop_codon:yes gene_type:complete